MAMMMARLYTGNYDVLALRNAYHGLSEATMGVTAHSSWKCNVPQVGPPCSFAKANTSKAWHYFSRKRVVCHRGSEEI